MANDPTPQDRAVASAQLVRGDARAQLDKFWKANKRQIAAVTAGGDVERVARVTYSLLYRNPKLIECTPFSLLNAIVLAHQMGLTLGTQEVAIVPYGREATLIIQYQGKCKLALASRIIVAINADVVIAGEKWRYYTDELGPHMLHEPKLDDRDEPSEDNVLAAYCILKTDSGGALVKVVTRGEILRVRERSRGYQNALKYERKDTPWISDFGAMAIKTAVHRVMKMAPMDPRLALAQAVEDAEEGHSAVIAEGLDPAAFADADVQQGIQEPGSRKRAEDVGLEKAERLQQQQRQQQVQHPADQGAMSPAAANSKHQPGPPAPVGSPTHGRFATWADYDAAGQPPHTTVEVEGKLYDWDNEEMKYRLHEPPQQQEEPPAPRRTPSFKRPSGG